MYDYDVRNQIRNENKSKLFGEVCVIVIVIAIILCFMYGVHVDNPFRISSPKTDKEISSLYKEGHYYISLDSVDLSYTGYYKENAEGKAIYNCYKLTFDKLHYFVFIPLERSGKDLENPQAQLKNYSLEGKLRQDKTLLELVAKDYNLDVDSFIKEYDVSPIMIDEVRNNRSQMLIAWILFLMLLGAYAVYIIFSFWKAGDPYSRREIKKLGGKEEIDHIFNKINQEVSENILLDTNKVKVTKNWFLAFYDGNVILILRNQIHSVKGTKKVKKLYGISKIGFRIFIEIVLDSGIVYEIPVEEPKDYEEILHILNDLNNGQNV